MSYYTPTTKYELRINGFFEESFSEHQKAEDKYLSVKDTTDGEVTLVEVVESVLMSSRPTPTVPFSTRELLAALVVTLDGWDEQDCEMVFDVDESTAEELLQMRDFIQENCHD